MTKLILHTILVLASAGGTAAAAFVLYHVGEEWGALPYFIPLVVSCGLCAGTATAAVLDRLRAARSTFRLSVGE